MAVCVPSGCRSELNNLDDGDRKNFQKVINALRSFGGYDRAIAYIECLRVAPSRVDLGPVDFLRQPPVARILQRPTVYSSPASRAVQAQALENGTATTSYRPTISVLVGPGLWHRLHKGLFRKKTKVVARRHQKTPRLSKGATQFRGLGNLVPEVCL